MERRVEVAGCHNFRDLGGYPTEDGREVRWRTLFRADALHELTPTGVAAVRDELGIAHIVDLRSSAELELDGRGPLEREPVRFHHMPLFDRDATGPREPVAQLSLGQLYIGMVLHGGKRIAAVIETLAVCEGPAVFHCAAGKDRTGVISALLLGALGVSHEIIVVDYAATRDALDGIVERLRRSRGYDEMWNELPPETLHADPATMVEFLGELSARFGSVRDCVLGLGVSESALAQLELRMLAPQSG